MATAQQIKVQGSVCKGNVYQSVPFAIENRTKSTSLIKDISGLIVSSILYYRKILPDEVFIDKKLGIQKVKILKANTEHTLADNFCKVFFSACDAIDLGYLKKMSIIFVENNQAVEVHRLCYEHTGESYQLTMIEQSFPNSKIQLKHQIADLKDQIFKTISSLIRTLISIEHCIENPSVAFELSYFNEITPKDYQPTLFEPLDGSKDKHRLATQPINFGHVATPFHSVKLKSQFKPTVNEKVINYLEKMMCIQTESTDILESETQEKKTTKRNKINNADNLKDDTFEAETVIIEETNVGDNNSFTDIEKEKLGRALNEDPNIKEECDSPVDEIDLSGPENQDTQKQQDGFRCPCLISHQGGVLVQCGNCKLFQHAYCFDMLTEEHIPSNHICDICAKNNPQLMCTVPELRDMDKNAKLERSLLRLSLGLCYFNKFKITKEFLIENLTLIPEYAENLINQLKQMKILNRRGSGTMNKLMFERITVPKIFQDHSVTPSTPDSPILGKRARRRKLWTVTSKSPPFPMIYFQALLKKYQRNGFKLP